MAPASHSARFQSLPPLPTVKLGPSGAGSRVGGLVHALGPCGSLQRPLLWGWESLLLPPQPPRAFSIRGLWLYFPGLEPWVKQSASLPAVCLVYLCVNVGPRGLLVVRLPAPFVPHCQSRSRQGNTSPLCPGCPSPPLLLVWMNVYFFISLVSDFLSLDFLSVLVVRGGAVCLPTPPSWFSTFHFLNADCVLWWTQVFHFDKNPIYVIFIFRLCF